MHRRWRGIGVWRLAIGCWLVADGRRIRVVFVFGDDEFPLMQAAVGNRDEVGLSSSVAGKIGLGPGGGGK